jgi:Protein of unknown function (DUF2934)
MQLEPQLISIRAYQLWEQEGRPHGRDQAHWFEAERALQELQREPPVANSSAEASLQPRRRGRAPRQRE